MLPVNEFAVKEASEFNSKLPPPINSSTTNEFPNVKFPPLDKSISGIKSVILAILIFPSKRLISILPIGLTFTPFFLTIVVIVELFILIVTFALFVPLAPEPTPHNLLTIQLLKLYVKFPL